MAQFGDYFVPILIAAIIIFALIKNVNVFDSFISGAREGISISIKILPTLVGLITAVAMFKASGALDLLTYGFKPVAKILAIPEEILPLAFLRPISGSGALALMENILKQFGPDSYIGRVAAVIQGSTETTFYAIAVYFGSIGIKNTKNVVPAALAADMAGFVMSAITVRLFF